MERLEQAVYWNGISNGKHLKYCFFIVYFIAVFIPGLSSETHAFTAYQTFNAGAMNIAESFIIFSYEDVVIMSIDSNTNEMKSFSKCMPDFAKKLSSSMKTVISAYLQKVKRGIYEAKSSFNSSIDTPVVQILFRCELDSSNANRSYANIGLNGKSSFRLDVLNPTSSSWAVDDPLADPIVTVTKQTFTFAQHDFTFFLTVCFDVLKAFVRNECFAEKKKVPLKAKLSVIRDHDITNMKCTVTGFYPKDIYVYFVKNDKDKVETDTSTGILPNSDGTYYIEKYIEIEPQDKYHHSCHVEHESLKPKLIVRLDPGPNIALIVGIIGAVVVAIIVAVVVWKKKIKGGGHYTPANKNDRAESSSPSEKDQESHI